VAGEKVFLLDLDGTLTAARRRATYGMLVALSQLAQRGRVGIVSGSGFDYIFEQLGRPLHPGFLILPCNGTQVFEFDPGNEVWKKTFGMDMRQEVGQDNYAALILELTNILHDAVRDYRSLPLTGNFISYRPSLVNFCPIGRDAGLEERAAFVRLDQAEGLRKWMLQELQEWNEDIIAYPHVNEPAPHPGFEFALGGQTSLDIFPKGWDKSFALRHFPDQEVYFVGDKCTEGGNDYAIFKALEPLGRAFQTTGPEQTLELIGTFIKE